MATTEPAFQRSQGISWYDAWRAAATGPDGFWSRERPMNHFRTASAATGLVARMLLALLADRPEISTVVDIGAGDGRLLAEVGALAPAMGLIGLDLRPAPADAVFESTGWLRGHWDVDASGWRPTDGPGPVPLAEILPCEEPLAIVAAEWLDDLPLVVADRTTDGWRRVLVRPDGRESVGEPVSAADAAWLDRWWPAAPGHRVESGRTRDVAWSAVIDCLASAGGLAIMIDYGHRLPDRPMNGTLTGYQYGRQVPPRPSSMINLTANVAVDSVADAGEASGARTELLISQRDAVERLLPSQRRTGGSDTLARLQFESERRFLADTLGDHWWLVQSVRSDR